jgi:arylsulfatase A-like enzyme
MAEEQTEGSRPNILWICSDQQRFDTLGCYGNPFVRTPNLDGLAENGTLFERCYSQSPFCTPSRASFLTGRYPQTTRTRQNGQSIPADEVLMTRMLAEAGYACGLSGKLHISACDPKVCPTTERRIDDGYREFHWSHHTEPDWPSNDYNRWLAARGTSFKTSPCEGSNYVEIGMPVEHHQTTWCAEEAIKFMEAAGSSGRPWLFSVNTFDPHQPFDPPADYLRRYLGRLDEIPLPNYAPGELSDKPIFQQTDHCGAYNEPGYLAFDDMSDTDHRMVRAAYWTMVDLIDEQVGRMLDALEQTGQAANTIVIFMSDHGEMLGDHGIYLKGPYFYEPLIHVPLIISYPPVVLAGRRSRAMVELVDLAQTLLDAAGLPHHPGMQGRSIWPMLTGRADPHRHRDDVYCESYNAIPTHTDPVAHATMVRTDRYKLVAVHGMDGGELYDLDKDPDETTNRWGDPAYESAKLMLLKRLCDRMAWTADPLPVREGRY